MERRTKLVDGCLGLCCVFMVFMSVSSLNVYNPHLYIKTITELLNELSQDLANMNLGDVKLEGPRNRALENDKACVGTFLDIFQHGTKRISNLILNHSVHNITGSIDDCVNKLRRDCHTIQILDSKCKEYTHKENVVHFLNGFLQFSKLLRSWNICGKKSEGREFSGERFPDKAVSVCGHR